MKLLLVSIIGLICVLSCATMALQATAKANEAIALEGAERAHLEAVYRTWGRHADVAYICKNRF